MTPKSSDENKDLVQQQGAAVPTTVGAPKLGRGHEEQTDMEDMEMPRAKLIQFTSEEAQAEDKTQRKDPGTIVNSITKEELGNVFIPIFNNVSFVQWNPRKKDDPNYDPAFEPGEMVFSTTDRRDARVVDGIKFGPNGEPPKITKYMNFLCFFPGQNYPLVMSFAKTSAKAGARLNTLTKVAGGDMFAFKYKLIVTMRENAGTKFFVLDVAPAGKATEEEAKIGEHWWEEFRGKQIKIHSDAEHAADGAAPGQGWSE